MAHTEDIDGFAEVTRVLNSWVSAQLDFWDGRRFDRRKANDYFDWLNQTSKDVFVFLIEDQEVQILPKPQHYTPQEMHAGSHEPIKRALLYRQFLSAVMRERCPPISCRLAMTTDDMAVEPAGLPLFSFQKTHGSHAVLLPDIDALIYNFYEGYDDGVPYDKKINRAVFVGSTTGEMHTQQSVRALSNERLRLGVYFRDSPDIRFSLPNITQCDSPATESDIRVLGFGTGALSWPQQFEYRFLLSVDGNGATCSRVAIALKSNSVLLKFDSPHRLYYFDGLRANTHYVPIADPGEVQVVLDAERRSPGLHAPIAAAGSEFYRTYLTRMPTLAYTALLLQRYARLFQDETAQSEPESAAELSSPRRLMPSARSDVQARCVAHIRDRGDVAFDLDSWIGDADGQAPLEGFQIFFETGIDGGHFSCRILTGQNAPWQQQSIDAFVGSRSQATPLLGVAFELAGAAADKYDCIYAAKFVNGTTSPVCSNGEPCSADGLYAIRAFKIAFPLKPVATA